jgi:hypothetical protein
VAGLVALNTGGWAGVNSVSCPAAEDCAVGGFYSVGSGQVTHAFVVDERNGVWGAARQAATKQPGAWIGPVSCSRPGNCSAGGAYDGGVFVLSENNGTWGTPQQVAGVGGVSVINSISCPSACSCSAGGEYDIGGCCFGYGFVVSERHGIWESAEPVPACPVSAPWPTPLMWSRAAPPAIAPPPVVTVSPAPTARPLARVMHSP